MPTLILSPEADQELLDIWLYIAEDSLVTANRFLDRMEGKTLKLSAFTEIGTDRPALGATALQWHRAMLLIRPHEIRQGAGMD